MEQITLFSPQQWQDVVAVPPVNSYSTLAVPAYWRGIDFLASNMASFCHEVETEATEEDQTAHPVSRLLDGRANQNQTSYQFLQTLYFHRFHAGNGYAYIRRNGARIAGLYNLDPADVTPFRVYDQPAEGEPIDYFSGTQWYWYTKQARAIPAADIIHLPGLGYDGLVGYSPWLLMSDTFETARAVIRYEAKYLRSGTVIRGVVELPAGVPEEQQNAIVARLARFKATTGDKDILVLSDGAKLSGVNVSARDAALVELGQVSTKRIAQVLGVPPEYLFERSESKYNSASIEQVSQDVVKYVFRVHIEAAEAEFTAKLLTEQEQAAGLSVEIDPDELLRGDPQTQVDLQTKLVGSGLATKNEARLALGLPRDPNPASDVLLDPTHLGTASTTPVAEKPIQPEPGEGSAVEESNQPKLDAYAALAPVIAAAVERVEVKTTKAIENAANKTAEARTVWGNVFATEQARYAAEALEPVAVALAKLGAKPLDAKAAGQRYGQTVRALIAGKADAKKLAEIVTDLMGVGNEAGKV